MYNYNILICIVFNVISNMQITPPVGRGGQTSKFKTRNYNILGSASFFKFLGFFFVLGVTFEKCTSVANLTLHIILDVCK